MAEKTINELLAADFTERAIILERVNAGSQKTIILIIRELARTLKSDVNDIDPNDVQYAAARAARMSKLLDQVRATVQETTRQIQDVLGEDQIDLSKAESKFVLDSINKTIGVELASEGISSTELRSLVDKAVLNGTPLQVFWKRFSAKVTNGLHDQLRQGFVAGDNTAQLAARVTKVTDLAQSDAVALVRTANNAVSNLARQLTYQKNNDVVEYIIQRSVLDLRTSDTCMAYSNNMWTNDGKFTPVGNSLPFNGGPPRHIRCRAFLLPVIRSWANLEDLKTGGRPSNDPEKYFRDRLKGQGVEKDDIDRIIRKAKARMVGGPAEDFSYEEWLSTKSTQYQQDVLGPTKYKLWKAGKISLRDLVDQSGNPLTVKELVA